MIAKQGAPNAVAKAEGLLLKSLAIACEQTALAWELRTTTSLARLLRGQGRSAEARDRLGAVYGRFHEGFATADLRAAKALLDDLEAMATDAQAPDFR
jgi:hypothetical protein